MPIQSTALVKPFSVWSETSTQTGDKNSNPFQTFSKRCTYLEPQNLLCTRVKLERCQVSIKRHNPHQSKYPPLPLETHKTPQIQHGGKGKSPNFFDFHRNKYK
ncbi:hypothetical protein CEXT_270411 [Caerostris extrusa]|uniref:Uncharacterized protein n=1 Tax=Caerostris extrusa TaxID=172846 RepID=A0AAV4XPW9_CAEEX|nr:hypothetical protein CEXT_270411 [Caerostris extrusa]